jgi:hypothetical protein
MLKKESMRLSTASRQGPMTRASEHGNETSGSIADGEFLDHASDHHFIGFCSMEFAVNNGPNVLTRHKFC